MCLCAQGLHPRIIADGFEAAKDKALATLEEVKVTKEMDRETLVNVARTSLRTKVHKELGDLLTEVSRLQEDSAVCRTLQGGGMCMPPKAQRTPCASSFFSKTST